MVHCNIDFIFVQVKFEGHIHLYVKSKLTQKVCVRFESIVFHKCISFSTCCCSIFMMKCSLVHIRYSPLKHIVLVYTALKWYSKKKNESFMAWILDQWLWKVLSNVIFTFRIVIDLNMVCILFIGCWCFWDYRFYYSLWLGKVSIYSW